MFRNIILTVFISLLILPVFAYSQSDNLFNLLGEAENFEINVRIVGKQEIYNKLGISKINLKNNMVTHLKNKGMRIENRSSNMILLTLTILEAKECYTFDIEINVLETVLSAKSYDPGRAAVYSTGSVGYICNLPNTSATINNNVNVFLDDLVNDFNNARNANAKKAGKPKKPK